MATFLVAAYLTFRKHQVFIMAVGLLVTENIEIVV